MKIEVIQADITKLDVDIIVNAANTSLLGGSGVDGVIHRRGGSELLEDCQKIRARQGGCKVGEAVITRAGALPAKYVIHTVGPVWNGGEKNECDLLKQCYLNSLHLAEEKNAETIAFPNISTGIYKFPKQLAAEIAINTITEYLNSKDEKTSLKVLFICYETDNYNIYSKLLEYH